MGDAFSLWERVLYLVNDFKQEEHQQQTCNIGIL